MNSFNFHMSGGSLFGDYFLFVGWFVLDINFYS